MKTTINDFNFQFTGHGHYNVSYTSPVTGKVWTKLSTNMRLIDATKNADDPKQADLNDLKKLCKS